MTHWNRRQFGLWSGAALLLPTRALAGDPTAQAVQQAVEPPRGLEGLRLQGRWVSADDFHVTYTVSAWQPGPKGLSLRVDLDTVELEMPGERYAVMAWLNDQHPYSRRVMAPDFVDVPANRTLAVAKLHANVTPDQRKAGHLLHVSLRFWEGETSRAVALAPLPVVKPDKTG